PPSSLATPPPPRAHQRVAASAGRVRVLEPPATAGYMPTTPGSTRPSLGASAGRDRARAHHTRLRASRAAAPRSRSGPRAGPRQRPVRDLTLSPPFFFLPREHALDAARMHADAESLRDTVGQLAGASGGLLVAQLLEKGDDLGRQLVTAPRSTFLGQESRQAAVLEGALGLIERRPREVKRHGGRCNALGVDLDRPDHVVCNVGQ